MSDNISAIDKAIQAAQARKAAKQSGDTDAVPNIPATSAKAPNEPKRPRLTDEEKAVHLQAKDAERAAKKAEREAARAAKRAARDAMRSVPHMSKVEKAASKLPILGVDAQIVINEVTVNFDAATVAAIAAHLNHFNRVKATERSLNQHVAKGATVRIVSGDSRYVGQTGEVSKAQRIRCYVTVPGAKKPIYCFISDVELVSADTVTKTA